jgi:hypothetical protein
MNHRREGYLEGVKGRYLLHGNRRARRRDPRLPTEVVHMMDRYNRLPPEEQRIIVVTLLGAAASLWLAVAWEEVMVLAALPLLALVAWVLIRSVRRRVERHKEKFLY